MKNEKMIWERDDVYLYYIADNDSVKPVGS